MSQQSGSRGKLCTRIWANCGRCKRNSKIRSTERQSGGFRASGLQQTRIINTSNVIGGHCQDLHGSNRRVASWVHGNPPLVHFGDGCKVTRAVRNEEAEAMGVADTALHDLVVLAAAGTTQLEERCAWRNRLGEHFGGNADITTRG